MESFLSVSGQCVTQKVIEKSNFITTLRHVENDDEAKAFVAEINKKYADATHNCYAYIADTLGNLLRFSDDGEPQGTAGMPMLEVLRAQNLVQVAAVVTRYFGGIKLGAGGLVRAYSGAVAEALTVAQKVCYEPCTQSAYAVGYSAIDSCLRFFQEHPCNVLSTTYGQEAVFVVAVKTRNLSSFNASLTNLLNGKLTITPQSQSLSPFPI
jgi:uncharacterized YigZ family protein